MRFTKMFGSGFAQRFVQKSLLRHGTKINISHFVTLAFGAVAAVLAIVALVTPPVPSLIENMSQKVAHSQQAIISLNAALATLEDVEAGQRGYLLTQDTMYLTRCEAGQARINAEINNAERLTAADLVQPRSAAVLVQQRFAALRAHVKTGTDGLERTLALYRRDGLPAALSRLRAGQGEQEIGQARRILTDMRAQQRYMLAQDLVGIRIASRQAKRIFSVGCAMIFVLAGGLYTLLRP